MSAFEPIVPEDAPNVLAGMECSGMVREALRRRGINAWSCDLQAAEDGSEFHIQGDVRDHLALAPNGRPWDAAAFFPVCRYLTLAGVQWLLSREPSTPRILKGRERWFALFDAADFYRMLRDCGIPRILLENPRMHGYAQRLLGYPERQEVQPHFFGDPFLKATGFERINVPPLERTHWMDPPVSTKEPARYAQWAACHHASPTKNPDDRERARSRFHRGMADAVADALVRSLQVPA